MFIRKRWNKKNCEQKICTSYIHNMRKPTKNVSHSRLITFSATSTETIHQLLWKSCGNDKKNSAVECHPEIYNIAEQIDEWLCQAFGCI
jgi:hypothetical protein